MATTGELKSKLDAQYDRWIRRKFEQELPEELHRQVAGIFNRYRRDKSKSQNERRNEQPDINDSLYGQTRYSIDEEEGGTDSFFSWFFRGMGPPGILSGAAFHRNRLRGTASIYTTTFEDDRVSWLLDNETDPLHSLSKRLNCNYDQLLSELKTAAWQYYIKRSQQEKGFPRQHVIESYQVAGLRKLMQLGNEYEHRAQIILADRYKDLGMDYSEPPEKFPGPEGYIGAVTFFTELRKRPQLREKLWPCEMTKDFRKDFKRREQRRELISALARLGAAYISLYLLAIKRIGSFDLGSESETGDPEKVLICDYLDLLEGQQGQPGLHAFYELESAANAFDVILDINFPEIRDASLPELATVYGRVLQNQSPIGRMYGGINKRLIKQFRMPGYPLVLITTDVLQEGEDLHTFCKRIIHYGITWTPSAMEQRTGRIDRIYSLVQRQLDGRKEPPKQEELLQVHYPHLEDTVERFQVCRVMERLNRFIRLVHETIPVEIEKDSRIDINHEILQGKHPVPPVGQLLQSAFPVHDDWTRGRLGKKHIVRPDIKKLEAIFSELCDLLIEQLGVDRKKTWDPRTFEGRVAIRNGIVVPWKSYDNQNMREQAFVLKMQSQVVGDAILLRCASPVGQFDLRDNRLVRRLFTWQKKHHVIRLCARHYNHHHSMMTVENDRLFRVDTTQTEEVIDLVKNTILQADETEKVLLCVDEHWSMRDVPMGDTEAGNA